MTNVADDLACLLAAAIIDRRDEINASALQDQAGYLKIEVNPAVRSVAIYVVVEDRRRVA